MASTPGDIFSEATPAFSRFPSRRSVVHSTKGIVSCTQPLAARAGIKVLEQGGNAADAAVATAAALGLTEPMATGIGGDLFCLYYDATTRTVRGLNGTGRSPAGISLSELRTELGIAPDVIGEMPPHGAQSVTVPGAAAGWVDAVNLFGSGKLSLAQVLAPAVELCETGFPVGEICSNLWNVHEKHLKAGSPNFREVLKYDSNSPEQCRAPRPGELYKNPFLAKVLTRLGETGKKSFYEGDTAREIVEVVNSLGGHLTLDDMKHHGDLPPDETTPISHVFSGQGLDRPIRLWQHRPNSTGLTSLITLGLLQELERSGKCKTFQPSDHNSAEYLHTLIECFRQAFADSGRYVADPHHFDFTPERLFQQDYLAGRAETFSRNARNTDLKYGALGTQGGNTVYFSVTDSSGNACSFVNSNYDEWGSYIVPKNCGFALQNRGAGFTTDPSHPNAYAPRKRPYHTLTCPMLTDPADDSLIACYGCMGKHMQPQGHVQLLLNMMVFKMNPQEALDAPRIAIEVLDEGQKGKATDRVYVEDGIAVGVVEGLRKLGHECIRVESFARKFFGRGQIIRQAFDSGQRIYSAGSEPRSDGQAVPL